MIDYPPEKRQTELTIGSDNGAAIWFNGCRIFSLRFEISQIRPFDSSLIFPEDRNAVFFLNKIVITPDEDFIP